MEIGTQYEMFGDRSTQPTSQNDLKATRPIHPLERKKPPNNQVNDHFHPQFLLSTITLHPSRAISPAWFVNDHQLDKIPSHFPHNLSRSNRRLLWEVNQPTNQPTRLEQVLPRNYAKTLKTVDFHMDFQKVFFTTTKKSDKSGPWIGVVCADNLTNLGTATNTCYTLEGPRLFQDILNSLKLSYNSLRTMY